MIKFYKLNENKEMEICTPEEWKDFITSDRTIKQESVGGKWVSTVTLTLDHNFGFSDSRPVFFETMVFPEVGDYNDQYCERYHTYQEALDGHDVIVDKLKHGVSLDD